MTARLMALAIVPLLAATIALHAHTGWTALTSWWLGNVVLAIALGVPGLLVAVKRPDNAIGWLLLAAALTTAVAAAGREYLAFGFLGGNAPGWLWIGWFSDSLYLYAMAVLPLTLMLFPDGLAMSRRARWALLLPLISVLVGTFGSLFGKDEVDVGGRQLRNPAQDWLPQWLATAADSLATLVFFVSLIVAIALLALRYRRSQHEVRLQMKWVVWSGAIAVVELGTEAIPNNTISPYTGSAASALLTSSLCIAILRHRLFDIDLVISRTLMFAALTAFVVAAYLLVVWAAGEALGEPVQVGPGLVGTALVAVAFAPARQRLQRWVDRLMYGERKNPYRVMTQLSQRLDADHGQGELAVVVATLTQALKLPYAGILAPDGSLLAESGRRVGDVVEHSLTYQGSAVGTMLVQPRDGKPGFDRAERQFLADLARQVGAAVHAVRLSADVQASRLRLVNAKEEERRRLRRDLHDGLGPKLAALGLKVDAARVLMADQPARSRAVLDDVKADIRCTIDDIRRLVYGLRPPALDELGLVAALRECAQRFDSGGQDCPTITMHAPQQLPALPAAVEVAAYWIVNEAVTNVVRHAQARRCELRLSFDGALCLAITDDGAGLPDGWRPGVGSSSMAERAAELGGSLTVGARQGCAGTEVRARIPVVEAVP